MRRYALRRMILLTVLFAPAVLVPLSMHTAIVLAQEEAQPAEAGIEGALIAYLSAAMAVIGSSFAAAIALRSVASSGSALLAERPDQFTAVLLLGGLAEGIAVYGLLIGFLILGKV